MANMVVKQIQGTAYWAQVLGAGHPNFNKDGNEWSIDVSVDKETVKELKALGLGPKIKDGKEHSPYISFKRATVKKAGPNAGQPNQEIMIKSPDGKTDWDRSVKIGNGSTVRVKFSVNEVTGGPAKKKFIRADILSMQVYEHVPYVGTGGEFTAAPEADPGPKQAVGENW